MSSCFSETEEFRKEERIIFFTKSIFGGGAQRERIFPLISPYVSASAHTQSRKCPKKKTKDFPTRVKVKEV